MKVGDRVRVKRSKYKEIGPDLMGTVRSMYLDSIAVEIDCFTNQRSEYGWYYFTRKQLEQVTSGGTKHMEGNYRIAIVHFIDGSNTNVAYQYACYDDDIKEGDICVVKSAHHGFGIAKIHALEPKNDTVITREIVCKADFTAYNSRENARKRREELKKKMAARAAQLQEVALYAMLAKEDADMSELLKEYEGLGL